jgi:hypothetical protein
MKRKNPSESGQAIVLLAISIVVLLGFTALAVDGGMIFSDRRHAQNAADAAALAGALQKSNLQSDAVVIQAAERSVESNGFTTDQMSVAITPFRTSAALYPDHGRDHQRYPDFLRAPDLQRAFSQPCDRHRAGAPKPAGLPRPGGSGHGQLCWQLIDAGRFERRR